MELVDFNLRLEPYSDSRFKAVHYTAEFVNGDGERIRVTKDTRIDTSLLQEPFTAAWLLSHVIADFMSEVGAGN